ncbi:MAG: helix-hairpin-helix domain-containing protein [Myxococcales bacterium]|nr:helix-hairpin-helix domain-containing protein [Myxococcales bacterium]
MYNVSRSVARASVAILAVALLAGGATDALARRRVRRARKAPTAQQPQPSSEGVVNLNDANEPQLRLLPGIGHAKAMRIIAYRKRRKFRHTYEVIRVRGIGRRTFRKLRQWLAVKGPTTLTHKPTRKK